MPPPPNSAPIHIRPERPADRPAIHEVERQAFGRPDEADLVDRLRRSCPEYLSLVAECGDRIVGHVLFTPVDVITSAEAGRTVEVVPGMGLGPIGVLPELQCRGIGRRLIEEGLGTLRSQQVPFVVVLGEPAYYSRFGFEPAARYGIGCEFDGVPAGAFMAIVWDEEALRGLTGVARYSAEFQGVA